MRLSFIPPPAGIILALLLCFAGHLNSQTVSGSIVRDGTIFYNNTVPAPPTQIGYQFPVPAEVDVVGNGGFAILFSSYNAFLEVDQFIGPISIFTDLYIISVDGSTLTAVTIN